MKMWTICDKGHVHWGEKGAAGLLLRAHERGDTVYLLGQRARRVDFGGTWDIPGGAMREGESPELAARREAEEEVGSIPAYRVVGVDVQDCGGGWKFYVVTADVDHPFTAFSLQETDATGWFTRDEMNSLSLHPELRKWLDQRGFWSSQPID